MPNITITPQAVLLTSGQAVTFQATNAAGPVNVNWNLNPQNGAFATPTAGSQASSATYVAPQVVTSAQTIAVIASVGADSASASISLTPDAISIVPAKADLRASQAQQFKATVSAPPEQGTPQVTWILSPPVGAMDPTTGAVSVYTAPAVIPDSTTVNVIATTPNGKQAAATVNLASPPWQGPGAQFLGSYLLVVFSLVLFILWLWPPTLPTAAEARANRIEAESTLHTTKELQKPPSEKGQTNPVSPKPAGDKENKNATPVPIPGTTSPDVGGAKTVASQASGSTAANSGTGQASGGNGPNDSISQATGSTQDDQDPVKEAQADLKAKKAIEDAVNSPYVQTKFGYINREIDLMWLVLLGGALGAFLHVSQSYSDFVGNKTLKSSWAWWYSFRPFIGAGLALVFYAAIRGGFIAVANASSAKDLNAFAVFSISAMVGMFSKAATQKLGEVFDTVFKTAKAQESKDKLSGSQASTQAGTSTSGAVTTTGK